MDERQLYGTTGEWVMKCDSQPPANFAKVCHTKTHNIWFERLTLLQPHLLLCFRDDADDTTIDDDQDSQANFFSVFDAEEGR